MKITYIFPSRNRPSKFFDALENIHQLSEDKNFNIIGIFDDEDDKMNNDDVKEKLKIFPKVTAYYGVSTGKINAINRELDKIDFNTTDIICLHSDDFIFTKRGFDNDIREGFSDGFQGLLHYPDGHTNKKLITYPIMHIEYLKRFGYIYHPDYISVMADSEQQEVAKILGLYKYVDKNIMEHRHYRWEYGKPDELMIINESPILYRHDKLVFKKRRLINFGL